jgi:hypothetical protein
MLKPCEICGKEFEIRKSHYHLRKTCSIHCAGIRRGITKSAENSYQWKGGRKISSDGYVLVHDPGNPKEDRNGFVREHVRIIEKIIGKPLPKKSLIHHLNLDRSDNRHSNLIVCDNTAYHFLLHKRTRAFCACGNANWKKCSYCDEYDSPENMKIGKYKSYHRKCENKYSRERYLAKVSQNRNTFFQDPLIQRDEAE